ncbi:MAG: adenylate/guanylate cyclase domain-containing protein [Betaproteobacteria bacterium]|nr:adenylate/guanylate cyclase domain-containing protein [Betaproteobacteria bacterium]
MNGARPANVSRAALLAGFVVSVALGILTHYTGPGTRLDSLLFDAQAGLLRSAFPVPVPREVVVVGIDEATLQRINEPVTLWHRHLGDFLRAVTEGKAAAVGLDVALPDRSFNEIVRGYDEVLMTGILTARKAMPVVLAITIDSAGKPRPIYPPFLLVAGDKGTGFAVFPRDADFVVRRFDERLGVGGTPVPTFVGQLARGLGIEPGSGLINYTAGPAFSYVPLHAVLEWLRSNDGERLRREFEGRPVVLGTVLPGEDRVPQPVNLAAWEQNSGVAPGVLVQAQALRSVLGGGLLKPLPEAAAIGFIAAMGLLWFAGIRGYGVLAALVAGGGALFVAGTWLLRQGTHLPLGGVLVAAGIALSGRASLDALLKLRERRLLRRSFAGYVSPAVMEEILAGQLLPDLGGARKFVCVLFADIRGFTTRSEGMAPEAVIALLNRYFEGVVNLIHAEGGAVISFMGDGIMAVFGAPKPMDNPCAAAFAVAKAMQDRMAGLNQALSAEGIAPIEIGVGLHAGEAVIGHVGSSTRHDYTAIGDVTNVASRLEGLTKEAGYRVVCSRVIFDQLGGPGELAPLGPMAVKGHTPVEVYGWGPR